MLSGLQNALNAASAECRGGELAVARYAAGRWLFGAVVGAGSLQDAVESGPPG